MLRDRVLIFIAIMIAVANTTIFVIEEDIIISSLFGFISAICWLSLVMFASIEIFKRCKENDYEI